MPFGDLCALSDVTTWLQTGQNPFPAVDDALLTRLITAASQFIQSWLQRQIAVSDWIEIRDGNTVILARAWDTSAINRPVILRTVGAGLSASASF